MRIGGYVRAGTVAITILLTGCQQAVVDDQQIALQQQQICVERGFPPGSEAHKLCLLHQETTQRLELVERRLFLLESEVSRLDRWGGWRRWP